MQDSTIVVLYKEFLVPFIEMHGILYRYATIATAPYLHIMTSSCSTDTSYIGNEVLLLKETLITIAAASYVRAKLEC